MAADTDAIAPTAATGEDNLVLSLTSSSTTLRTRNLAQLNERIKNDGWPRSSWSCGVSDR